HGLQPRRGRPHRLVEGALLRDVVPRRPSPRHPAARDRAGGDADRLERGQGRRLRPPRGRNPHRRAEPWALRVHRPRWLGGAPGRLPGGLVLRSLPGEVRPAVIRSLEVRDLVVIERAEIEPALGLTAITGETGAGKTVLAEALSLLAGGPADAAAVRPGARSALVQATLALPEGFWDRLDEDDPARVLRDLAEDEREVVLSRRVPADGPARPYPP